MDPWKLISGDDARRLLLAVPPVEEVERVSLRAATGRVLAEALVAPHDLPRERRSAMDGYAGRAADFARAAETSGPTLSVVAALSAGAVPGAVLASGEVVSIATGAVVPDDADAVVMVEFTAREDGTAGTGDRAYVPPGGRVRITQTVPVGANVVPAGEDVRAGTTLLARGRRLQARDLSALATFGLVEVAVFRRPRIAVLATGNEICAADASPRPGQVRDSNQYVLAAEIEATGATVTWGGIVADDEAALRATVARLVAENDGLILSGGSSVGPKDLTGRVLATLGPPGVLFHGIDIRPGKPTILARAGAKPVVGMPGFPTSSMVVFEAFVRPMLASLCGETVLDAWPATARARLARAYSKPAAREDYLRVRLEARDGDVWAEVVPGGSAAISNVLFADGLAKIPAGLGEVAVGAMVDVRRFS